MFVGVSPEFEIALYTMLYVSDTEELEVQLGPYTANIKVYQMAGKIGTAFPELLSVDVDMLAEEVAASETAGDAPPAYSLNPYGIVASSEFPPVNVSVPYGEDGDLEYPPLGAEPGTVQEGFSYADAVSGGVGKKTGAEDDCGEVVEERYAEE